MAQCLGVTPAQLEKLLLFERKVILKETSYKAYSKEGCIANRNTLCKAVYNAAFEFIVHKIQQALNPPDASQLTSINLLDIFGFENFKENSLEQLCINFTN